MEKARLSLASLSSQGSDVIGLKVVLQRWATLIIGLEVVQRWATLKNAEFALV